MLINEHNLKNIFTGFNTSFNKGQKGAESHYNEIATVVPSVSRENDYAWLGQFPKFREWLGDRVINNLKAHSYTIENKDFESTISVPRNDIQDDRYGIFSPMFEEMGRLTREHPDELIFTLLKNGFTKNCYDGQYFFDTDHPVTNESGVVSSVSNYQSGVSSPWFLLDCSRSIKPLIFQERMPYKLTSLDKDSDQNVFMRKEYIYGVEARVNAGLGLWQMAYASKGTLDSTNFEAARTAMRSLKGDNGRPLGIKPTHLVVGPANEQAARRILESDIIAVESGSDIAGVSNIWKGTLKLVVSEWL